MTEIEWRVDLVRDEITLLVDGKRRGAIVPWAQRASHTPTGWSGILVVENGPDQEIMGPDSFWTPKDAMQHDVLKHLDLPPPQRNAAFSNRYRRQCPSG